MRFKLNFKAQYAKSNLFDAAKAMPGEGKKCPFDIRI
jgi:hypothetical protein